MDVFVREELIDDQAAMASADSGEMLLALASGAAQVRAAALGAREAGVERVADDGRPRAVVVTGVGSAAFVGDVLAALAGYSSPLPIVTVRGPELPSWVNAMDLVVAVSHSGATTATLAVFDEANRRGCRLLTVGAPDSPLAQRAEQARAVHVPVRRGRTQRANLWALTVPVVLAARHLNLVQVSDVQVEATADRLAACSERYRPASESFVNEAKTAAITIAGSLPLLWGTSALAAVAAVRFGAQLADNAKYPAVLMPAFDTGHGMLPALDGPFGARAGEFGAGDDLFRDRVDDPVGATLLRPIVFRDVEESPLVAARVAAMLDIASERGLAVTVVTAEGDSPLERFASLVAYADYVSVFLGLGLGFDPTPVPFAGDMADRIPG